MHTTRRILAGDEGFTFVELLAVVLLLGLLVLAAMPNFFGAEADTKSKVDQANVRAVNAALALYKFKNNGSCPADSTALGGATFFGSTTYFPDGAPKDPYLNPPTGVPYQNTYDAVLCRVKMSSGTVDHTTGGGH